MIANFHSERFQLGELGIAPAIPSQGTILVVDDTPANLMLMVKMLTPAGYHVLVAESGELALAAVAENPPDLILLDIRMKGMDGLEVCRRLKAREETQHIPIILLSAFAEVEEWVQGLQLGAVDYITKPFHLKLLQARVATHMALSRANVSLSKQTVALRQTNAQLQAEITERKLAEECLRKQAALLDMANDAIHVRGLDHTVRYWNQGAERLYGWTSAEALGRKITDLKIVDLAAFETAHAALLSVGTWTAELKQITKAGQPLTILCRWTLLRDAHGQPEEVLAINTDLTEHKKLELRFFHAQRIESIGSLAGGIAHDLNNILAPILMTAPLLRRTVSDPDSLMLIETMETCAQRGVEIIKQLLTFARGTPGVHVSLPVRLLMREMKNIIRETFPRNIQPFLETPKNLWPVLGDATQFHQALLNLCVNARDAMPEGGSLTLDGCNVTLDATSATMIPNAKPGLYVCVSVTDTGTGIPPEIQGRIFDPFFTTKEIGKGTGLGLATTLGIVRGHDGFVRVDSQLGRGTTFALYFPATPEAQAVAVLARETPPDGAGELILVVDDEACLLDTLRFTLEHHGYRALTATNGAEGLAAFSRQHAEVRAVLTDIMMPVMDGPVMITALRAIEPNLPILGMTGLLGDLKRLNSIKLSAWLAKPFTEDALLRTLHNTFHPAKAPARKGATQDD